MRVIGTAVIPALLLGLAACGHTGSSGGNGDHAGTAATAAAAAATASVPELARTAIANGQQAASVTATFRGAMEGRLVTGKVSADRSGNCSAQLDLAEQGKVDLLKTKDRVWLRFENSAMATALSPGAAGKFLTGPATGDGLAQGYATFCSMAVEQPPVATLDPGQLSRSGSATVGGVLAVEAATPSGEKVSISTANPPYIVRVVSGSDSEPYDYTFSDYGKPVVVTPPPADQTVELPAS